MTGKQVLKIRKRLGLTRDDLAAKLGVHWTTVSRWENNRARVTEPVAKLLRLLEKTEGKE